ncbi:MAG TPA: DNA-directed RNA polymerase subunit L [Archaeoglobaceae archaeon]|nr:DNA-directed RNA polymerase subunit L [Archaeoglobaceae archaeon]
MEVKILEMGKNHIRLAVKGEDYTFLNLLQHTLLEDNDVEIAKYSISHPLVGTPELYIKTKKKNPVNVLKRANERIADECEKLLSNL